MSGEEAWVQSEFQFTPKVFGGVEVRALEFFHSSLGESHVTLCTGTMSQVISFNVSYITTILKSYRFSLHHKNVPITGFFCVYLHKSSNSTGNSILYKTLLEALN